MTLRGRVLRSSIFLLAGFGAAWACGVDDTLREYLSAHFWLPFVKKAHQFEEKAVQRLSAPFAGMQKAQGQTPLATLRAAYQEISFPNTSYNAEKLQRALTAARSTQSLTPKEREEVYLIDAKIDLRAPSLGRAERLNSAKTKLKEFLLKARTPEYVSEARGWLAHVHFELEEKTAAGKIYLDELNRSDSNLSRDTILDSLRMTYGYDGGAELRQNLEQYFDTPEHAAFAIQLVTNPRWERGYSGSAESEPVVTIPPPYGKIKDLLVRHRNLLRSEKGAANLALLGMRTALRAGDPRAALKIAAELPGNSDIRSEPDFHWMLASAHFLSREIPCRRAASSASVPVHSLVVQSKVSGRIRSLRCVSEDGESS